MTAVSRQIAPATPVAQRYGPADFEGPPPPMESDPTTAQLLGRLRRRFIDPLHIFSAGQWLPIVRRLETPTNQVALSYDDGPTPETTPALIDMLAAYQATASFFLSGPRMLAARELVQELVAAGHDVFAHCWEHARFENLPSDQIVRNLDRTEELLSRYRKTPSPYLVRLPYGGGHRSARVHQAIAKWNATAQIAHWTVSTKDWSFPNSCSNEEQLRQKCLKAAMLVAPDFNSRGSIILLHEKPFDVQLEINRHVAVILTQTLLQRLEGLKLASTGIKPLTQYSLTRRYIRPSICR